MKFYFDLLKLSTRIYSNPIIFNSDTMVYCFSHKISTLDPMINMLKKYKINKVHIIKNLEAISGVETYDKIVEKYKENNIECILIPFNYNIIQTKYESNIVIKHASDFLYKNIIIVAPIFHILRATMTMISSAIEQESNLGIISIINDTSQWNQQCITHQGLTNDTIINTLELEFDRILKYMTKGDIKSTQKIWEYLDKVNNVS